MPAVVALLLAACLAGAALAQAPPEKRKIDAWIVRDLHTSAQFAVAHQLGYFRAEGLEVTPRWYVNAAELPAMWAAGEAHLGTAAATTIALIAAAGGAVYTIAPQSDFAGAQQVVLGKKAQELVSSPKDFEKLTVGMPQGAPITMAIQGMARATGVDFGKIRFVNLSPPAAITALARGDIDAMAAWAPWVFKAVKQADGTVYFTGNQSFIPGQEGRVDWLHLHAGVVASATMVKESPNTLKAVLRALIRATSLINDDRDTAVKILAHQMKMEEWLARDMMEPNVYSMEQTDQHVKGLAALVDFLHALGRIKEKFPAEKVFVTTLLEAVDPRLVKWKSKTEVR